MGRRASSGPYMNGYMKGANAELELNTTRAPSSKSTPTTGRSHHFFSRLRNTTNSLNACHMVEPPSHAPPTSDRYRATRPGSTSLTKNSGARSSLPMNTRVFRCSIRLSTARLPLT